MKQAEGPGANGRKEQQRPQAQGAPGAFTATNQLPFLDGYFKSKDAAVAGNSEACFKETLRKFYFQRFCAKDMTDFVKGIDPKTAQRIADAFNGFENTCRSPDRDLESFVCMKLQNEHITIDDPRLLEGAIAFLVYDAELYFARKSAFEAVDRELTKRYGEQTNRKPMDFYREKVVEVLEAPTAELTKEICRCICKVISYYPDTSACIAQVFKIFKDNYHLENALDDLSLALGGLTAKKLHARRVRLKWKRVEDGYRTVRVCVREGHFVHPSNMDPSLGPATWYPGSYRDEARETYVDVPSIVLKRKRFIMDFVQENLQKRPFKTIFVAGVIIWTAAYFIGFPPPQRFIIPSQRAELMGYFHGAGDNILYAEKDYREKHGIPVFIQP